MPRYRNTITFVYEGEFATPKDAWEAWKNLRASDSAENFDLNDCQESFALQQPDSSWREVSTNEIFGLVAVEPHEED